MRSVFRAAISALGLLSATHKAVAECDMAMVRANAIFIRAQAHSLSPPPAAHCEKNFLDTPAAYHALAISKQCASNMPNDEMKKRAYQAFKELDDVVRERGKDGACRWVGDLEKAVRRDKDKQLAREPTAQLSPSSMWALLGGCTPYEANASPAKGSFLKKGASTDDLGLIPGRPISCKNAVMAELPNGRKMIQFVTSGNPLLPLGFAGGSLDRKTNPKLLIMPLDRIYPEGDLGTGARPAPSEEGVLHGAEGFCFFDSHQFAEAKSVSCVAKHESGTSKRFYRVEMEFETAPSRLQGP